MIFRRHFRALHFYALSDGNKWGEFPDQATRLSPPDKCPDSGQRKALKKIDAFLGSVRE
jgi:hypothetical protein